MDVDLIIFLILAIVVLTCFTVFALLSYSGLFYSPVVSTGDTPWQKRATIAYKFIRGPYSGNDVGSTFTEVTSIAPLAPAIGIFYDDPSITAPDNLRSIIGCLVKEKVGETDERLSANDEQVQILAERGFKMFTLPSIEMAVLTDFVYTTPFSLWLASGRVFPHLRHYIDERNLCAYPFIEFYKDCKVFYAAPLSKQEDFFVEECHNVHQQVNQLDGEYKDLNKESESSSFEEIDEDTLQRKSSVAEVMNKKND